MRELSKFTKQLQAMLPQWMKMAKDDQSVGARFLNTFGLEFEDVQRYLDDIIANQYIDTVDLTQIDIAYKVPLALPIISDLDKIETVIGYKEEEPYYFRVASTLKEFYQSEPDEDICILDRDSGVLYIRVNDYLLSESVITPLDSLSINGAKHFEYSLHHIWNPLDEFGLLLGIDRLYGERNAAFKERILDVFRKPANSTKQGLINALSRELGIGESEVGINELSNKAFRNNLLNKDGSPSKKLTGYIDRINKTLGFTWDNMSWGEAYWRSVEETQLGLEYLPHVWNVTTEGWKDTDFQSGIGDGNDLLVRAPKEENNLREFKYYVGLRGMSRGTENIHPEISFKYRITADGIIPNEEYRDELFKYTVIASEMIKLDYIIRGLQQYICTTTIDLDMTTQKSVEYSFDNSADPGVEVVTGTTVMSNPRDPHLKVEMELWKNVKAPKNLTPSVEELRIGWIDKNGIDRVFSLNSDTDFTRNDISTMVNTEMSDISIEEGAVRLGFGDFYYKIDTSGSWEEGATEHVEVVKPGSIRLKLPKL